MRSSSLRLPTKLCKKNTLLFLICVSTLISGPIKAQSAQDVLTGLARCSEILSVAKRIDCYDSLAAETVITNPVNLQNFGASGAVSPQTNTSVPPPSLTTQLQQPDIPLENSQNSNPQSQESFIESEFGWEDKAALNSKKDQELKSSIVEIEEIRPRRIQITLANGQVWRQKNIALYRLRVGYEIRIYASGWGPNSFRLSASKLGSYIPIERVH